ncbi:hypothetical protein NEDG_00483 [Nematocida displodere]|uniref:Tubby C-terminal domain-containing protein n=1 Tax=Nematocida displodere TaxID=1805483 RepID=A0A177EJG0_9MICR|nr:hypothetical protein NEDG_00483 [Nematocida displodere]
MERECKEDIRFSTLEETLLPASPSESLTPDFFETHLAGLPLEPAPSIHAVPRLGETKQGKVTKKRTCFSSVYTYHSETGLSLAGTAAGMGWRIAEGEERVATLKGNFLGTRYILKTPDREALCVKYIGLYGDIGPRSFQVFIDPINTTYTEPLTTRIHKKQGKYIQLMNKQPYYNSETDAYVLNFSGRVTLPSVRNFQVIHPNDSGYITMTFGKVDTDEYILDYTYPWCAVDAFAVALSALGVKVGHE